jgi:hypothetical protein
MRLVKQLRATLGDAVSLWADFVTHANARYKDAISPFRRPVFRRLTVALIGLITP